MGVCIVNRNWNDFGVVRSLKMGNIHGGIYTVNRNWNDLAVVRSLKMGNFHGVIIYSE